MADFLKSIDSQINKLATLSREEVGTLLEKNKNKYIQEEINRIADMAKREGYPKINKRYLNKELKATRRALAEEENPLGARTGRRTKSTGGEMRKKYQEGGVEDQMETLMPLEEETMEEELPLEPDEEMEDDYVDFLISQSLDEEEEQYLLQELESNPKLSELFDKVMEVASEFSGSGSVEGPGTEVSDSIPARLSDGEFVFTAKATEEIGADNLQQMMEDAEASADQRQTAAYGGLQTEKEDEIVAPIQTTGLRAARRNVPVVAPTKRQVEEEMLKSSPRRFYQPLSG